MTEISLSSTPAESYTHKVIKQYLYDQIFESNLNITVRSLEKYIGKRYADVYFKFQNGKEIVIEVQHSRISVREIIQRTNDYNTQGVYILWILHGEGRCVAAPKYPVDSKETKISMAESYLHKIYGGRVYYLNLKPRKGKLPSVDLFALHYIKPYKKSKRTLFKGRYTFFYYRDTLSAPIKNLTMLTNIFAGNKIARFYDKNIKSTLKQDINKVIITYGPNVNKEKKLVKKIEKRFEKRYGKFLIYKCLTELYNENKIYLKDRLIQNLIQKIN
ncbi:MAG: competence protein CoiA family protein [Candidatus Hermodarchaeota archaeon]